MLIFQWKAHEGLILCIAWNSNNNLILSGSEDGYSKVGKWLPKIKSYLLVLISNYFFICFNLPQIWDTFGQQISVSVRHDQPITSVSWSPAGDMFVIGSYNLMRLCNANGVS